MVDYRFGPFELDAERLILSKDGAPVAVGPTVVRTLLALAERAGAVVSKAELMEAV